MSQLCWHGGKSLPRPVHNEAEHARLTELLLQLDEREKGREVKTTPKEAKEIVRRSLREISKRIVNKDLTPSGLLQYLENEANKN